MFASSPCRVWLQHGCCCAHHARLHARHLPDLLQLLPGDLRAHPAAVCGPGSGNSLRRCTPAPHTTGIGYRAIAPSSPTVSQPSHVYKDTHCCLWIKCLTILFYSFLWRYLVSTMTLTVMVAKISPKERSTYGRFWGWSLGFMAFSLSKGSFHFLSHLMAM